MHTEDVIFTKRKFEGFDSLNNFFGDDKTALDDYIYQIKNKIFNVINRLKIKNISKDERPSELNVIL